MQGCIRDAGHCHGTSLSSDPLLAVGGGRERKPWVSVLEGQRREGPSSNL